MKEIPACSWPFLSDLLTCLIFPQNNSSTVHPLGGWMYLQKKKSRPPLWGILGHSKAQFHLHAWIHGLAAMWVAEEAGECCACVQWDSPHCDKVQRHHCRGGRTPSWHMAVGPSPLHMAVQARSHFHTRPNIHRQTEGDWVSLKHHHGRFHAAHFHTLHTAQAAYC